MAVCTGFEPVICSVTGNRGRPDSSNRPYRWHRHSRLCTGPMPSVHGAQPRVAVPPCMLALSPAPHDECPKMVAGTGIEPACVAYETTEEPLLNPASIWSGRRDFNPRSPVPETGALSTRPLPVNLVGMRGFEPPPPCPQDRWAPVTLHPENLERLAGIEPVVESLEDSHSAIELQPRIWWAGMDSNHLRVNGAFTERWAHQCPACPKMVAGAEVESALSSL